MKSKRISKHGVLVNCNVRLVVDFMNVWHLAVTKMKLCVWQKKDSW